jgi:hypothetical protein
MTRSSKLKKFLINESEKALKNIESDGKGIAQKTTHGSPPVTLIARKKSRNLRNDTERRIDRKNGEMWKTLFIFSYVTKKQSLSTRRESFLYNLRDEDSWERVRTSQKVCVQSSPRHRYPLIGLSPDPTPPHQTRNPQSNVCVDLL